MKKEEELTSQSYDQLSERLYHAEDLIKNRDVYRRQYPGRPRNFEEMLEQAYKNAHAISVELARRSKKS